MEKIKSDVFKKILTSNRSHFNASFALARQTNIHLQAGIFLHYLARIIDSILLKHKAEDYVTLEKLTITLYDKILELCTKELLGKEGKYPGLEQSLILLMDSYPRLLINNTEDFISSITNAILNIYAAIGLNYKKWVSKLLAFKKQPPQLTQLLEYGLVAAWICGMAHYRESALRIIQKTGLKILGKLFDISHIPESWNSKKLKEKLSSLPWIDPHNLFQETESKERIVFKTVSNFIGYEGHFLKPPSVYKHRNHFLLSDGTNHYRLYADVFGHSLIREQVNIKDLKKSPLNQLLRLTKQGMVTHKNKQYKVPGHLKLPILSQAATGNTLVFTSRLSHKVFIVGIKQ